MHNPLVFFILPVCRFKLDQLITPNQNLLHWILFELVPHCKISHCMICALHSFSNLCVQFFCLTVCTDVTPFLKSYFLFRPDSHWWRVSRHKRYVLSSSTNLSKSFHITTQSSVIWRTNTTNHPFYFFLRYRRWQFRNNIKLFPSQIVGILLAFFHYVFGFLKVSHFLRFILLRIYDADAITTHPTRHWHTDKRISLFVRKSSINKDLGYSSTNWRTSHYHSAENARLSYLYGIASSPGNPSLRSDRCFTTFIATTGEHIFSSSFHVSCTEQTLWLSIDPKYLQRTYLHATLALPVDPSQLISKVMH